MTASTQPTFICACCGACCRWKGYVRLTPEEVDRIAAYLGVPPREFIERYTEITPDRRSLTLREHGNGTCVMLGEDGLCRIHEVKPNQCRTFPERWRVPGFESLCKATRGA